MKLDGTHEERFSRLPGVPMRESIPAEIAFFPPDEIKRGLYIWLCCGASAASEQFRAGLQPELMARVMG